MERNLEDIQLELLELKNDLGGLEHLYPYEHSYVVRRLHEVLIELELAAVENLTDAPKPSIFHIEPFA